MTSHDHHAHHAPAPNAEGEIVRDPVCGMIVDPTAGKPSAEHGGRMFHFCSAGCHAKFVAEPEAYLTATDPVCGMDVDRASARHFHRHEGDKFYFCSAGCKGKFRTRLQSMRPEPQRVAQDEHAGKRHRARGKRGRQEASIGRVEQCRSSRPSVSTGAN